MSVKILIIGASGTVGSEVIKSLEKNKEGLEPIYSTSNPKTKEKWEKEGKNSIILDLNKPESFENSLKGINRIFLLTGYSSDMLYQSKTLIDAAKKVGIEFIVHLGLYTSRDDFIPHFTWHDLIECYLKSSGIPYTNIHPNVITDTVINANKNLKENHVINSFVGDEKQGWVCTKDIADVTATVLKEGPEKHNGKDYYLSIDLLTMKEIANLFAEVSGKDFKVNYVTSDEFRKLINSYNDIGTRNYMESAFITMELTRQGKLKAQYQLKDDVLTVVGRPGIKMKDWIKNYYSK